jgi:predicted ATP-grasp superfamily ATP-dependent carboligase
MDMPVCRILVTDAQDRPALAATRCLHASGYHVSATAIARWAPGLWSRYCSMRRVVPDVHHGIDPYVDALEQVVREQHHDILLSGTDETLFAVSTRRERLAPLVALGLPDHEIVRRALSKETLATEAANVGFPTPEGRICERLDDALEAGREFGFPLLVKGVDTIAEIAGEMVRYPTQLVDDEDQLAGAYERMGRCIVQRRCVGNMLAFLGVATDRGMLGSVLNRYHRTWPPVAGMASFSETVPIPPELSEHVGALIDAIGWRGLFQLQLIEDEDGVLRPIDLNPRLFGSLSVARAAGVPLSSLWCEWLLGRDPRPRTARPGVAYRWEQGDARRLLWQLRHGDAQGALAAAMPRHGTIHPYFAARDPLPFVAQCAELAAVRFRHSSGRD